MNKVEITEIGWAAICIFVAFGFFVMVLILCHRAAAVTARVRVLMSELDAILNPGPFLTLHTEDGILKLRSARIISYRYDTACNSLVIEDGAADPIVLCDPKQRIYNSLQQQITDIEKGRR